MRGVLKAAWNNPSVRPKAAFSSFSSKLKGSNWIGLVLTPLESHRLGLKRFEYAEAILYAHLPKNPVDMILHRLFGKI